MVNKCVFKPSGETMNQCKSLCRNNMKKNGCFINDCIEICNNCNNETCKWNLSAIDNNNQYKPKAIIIKIFPGNKSIKITWLKPDSLYPMLKYYIIISGQYFNISLHRCTASLEILYRTIGNNF